ncbi:MAG TPA: aldehyde dehydrogenase family protein [Trebonia sp.]|nr:aldehyde dehydrogenase family protein [Trebonia sp.]
MTADRATGQTLANVAEGDAEDINRAVRAARRAFDEGPWGRLTPSERGRISWRIGDLILRAEGATAVTGGGRFGDQGYFVEPTVLTNVRPDMKVVREEIFGPVVVVAPFQSIDDIAANDSDYGLGPAGHEVLEAYTEVKAVTAQP